MIDNTPSIICVKGRDHRYQLINREFELWCGLTSDKIVGHTAKEMPWGPLIEGGWSKDRSVLVGGGTMQEEELITRDGHQRTYLTTLLSDEDDRQVVEAIVGVARKFKIATIAEGVEDQVTLDELHRMGVDYVQGYHTGRPVPLPVLFEPPRNRRRGDVRGSSEPPRTAPPTSSISPSD